MPTILDRADRHPTVVLPALALLSAALGAWQPGPNLGAVPGLGIFMPLPGLWFGLVVGLAVARWGTPTWPATALACAAVWLGWEVSVNIAIQIDQHWSSPSPLSKDQTSYLAGFLAGAAGALLTWGGVAAMTPSVRRLDVACGIVGAGAVLGLALPWSFRLGTPFVLLAPWEMTIAGLLGLALVSHGPGNE